MNRSIISVLAFALCLSSGDLDHNGIVNFDDLAIFADNWLQCGNDGGDLTDQNEVAAVMIVLTKLEITHQTLELGYKLKNTSDHDVWLCDSLDIGPPPSPPIVVAYEAYLAEDAETLLIRRRFDVPEEGIKELAVLQSRYIRLCPGQERAESLSLAVPVSPQLVLAVDKAQAEYATRLTIEIGYYDEDLPGLIRRILEVAEKLKCTKLLYTDIGIENIEIFQHYFAGLVISSAFGGLSGFNESQKDMSEQILIPYMGPVLSRERALQLVVDGLYIPYQGYIPLTSHAAKGQGPGKIFETRPQKRTRPVDGEGSMHCEYFFQ